MALDMRSWADRALPSLWRLAVAHRCVQGLLDSIAAVSIGRVVAVLRSCVAVTSLWVAVVARRWFPAALFACVAVTLVCTSGEIRWPSSTVVRVAALPVLCVAVG